MHLKTKAAIAMGVVAALLLRFPGASFEGVSGGVFGIGLYALSMAAIFGVTAGWYLLLLRICTTLQDCGWFLGIITYALSLATYMLIFWSLAAAAGFGAMYAYMAALILMSFVFGGFILVIGAGALTGWAAQKYILEHRPRDSKKA
jgi:hypothetical protein